MAANYDLQFPALYMDFLPVQYLPILPAVVVGLQVSLTRSHQHQSRQPMALPMAMNKCSPAWAHLMKWVHNSINL